MSHSAATAQSPRVQGPEAPGRAPGQPGASPWWKVSWSVPAAMRAVRATIVIPILFAITYKVIGDAQMTLFAVFGGFATLVVTSFGGTRRDKLIAHAGLAAAGTRGHHYRHPGQRVGLAGRDCHRAGRFRHLLQRFGRTERCRRRHRLPVRLRAADRVGGVGKRLPPRLEGWWLASAAGTAAVLLLSPRSPGDRLRGQAARLAGRSRPSSTGLSRHPGRPGGEAVLTAKHELMNAFDSTPYRPIGLAAADQGLANLIHLLEWCAALVGDAADGHLDLTAAAPEDRALLEASALALHQVAAITAGQASTADIEPVWQARLASARHLIPARRRPCDRHPASR